MTKAYTNLEQSKKLAEFLPLESADMWYDNNGESIARIPEIRWGSFIGFTSIFIPCWSLAALLDVLPRIEDLKPVLDLEINYTQYPSDIDLSATADNAVDACVEMILKLHELKML